MISQTILLLKSNDHYKTSPEVEIAKGRFFYGNWKKRIKRIYNNLK